MVRLDRKAPFPVIHRDPTAKQVFNNFTPRDTAIVGAATIGTGFYGYAIDSCALRRFAVLLIAQRGKRFASKVHSCTSTA
eukprot:6583-Heterococcus_DN1.PRE.1